MDYHGIDSEQHAALRERVARLEALLPGLDADIEELKSGQYKTQEKLDILLTELTKYKGRWGGILLAASAIIAAVKFILDYGTQWLRHS